MNETDRPADIKRDQILQAAVLEFQENGYLAASMDSISARAGASKRTVYRYFESKEKLFQTLIHCHWAKFAQSLTVKYEMGRDIGEQLSDLGHAEGRLLTAPDVMATTKLVMSEILRSPELVGENQQKIDYMASFETMLRDAAADGQLCIDNPRDAAEEFMSLLKGKAFWPVIFGAPVVSVDEMAKIVDSTVAYMMSRYGP